MATKQQKIAHERVTEQQFLAAVGDVILKVNRLRELADRFPEGKRALEDAIAHFETRKKAKRETPTTRRTQ